MKKIFSLVAVGLLAGSAFADELAEGTYYIKQASSDAYLTRGQAWGTQAVVEPFGHPWKVSLTDGKYKLQMLDIFTEGATAKGLGDNGYTDGANQDVTITSSSNGYVLMVNGKNISVNDANAIAVDTENQTEFEFLTAAQYKAALAASTVAQEAAVATAAGLTLGDSTLSAYLSANYAAKAVTEGYSTVPVSGGTDWTFTAGRNGSSLNYGTYGIECYQGSGSLIQSITGLKEGIYKVGIKAMQRSTSNGTCYTIGQQELVNSGCYLSANSNVVNIKDWYSSCTSNAAPNNTAAELAIANDGGYYSAVYAYVGKDGQLDLKVAFPSYWGYGWFVFNGIDLTYYMDKSSGLTAYVEEFDGLKAVADSLLKLPMDSAVKAALDSAIVTPAETVEAYTEAVSNLKTAIGEAKYSTAKYDNVAGHDVTILASETWVNQKNTYKDIAAERFSETAYEPGKILYQNITGLVPGAEYQVSFYATANMAWKEFATGAGIAQVFANDSAYDISVIAQTGCDPVSDDYLRTLKATVGKDGVLQFGIQNIGIGGNWYVAKTKAIISVGNTTVATYANVSNAIDAVRKAIKTASESIVADAYPSLVKLYQDSLMNYSSKVDSVASLADSLFAEVAISGKSDSLIALLPTVAQVQAVASNFSVELAASKHVATKKAKLVHTASVCWGSNTGYNNVDGEKAHYNNDAATGWSGCAFAEFDFTGMNAKSVEKATLSWHNINNTAKGNVRDNKVYYLTPGTELAYDTLATGNSGAEYRFENSRTYLGNVAHAMNIDIDCSLDVADAIRAAVAAGQTKVVFMWTGNAGSGDLAGKANAEKAPSLDINYDMAPKMKLTKIQDFEGEGVATWTANASATCSVGENAGNHYAAANVNGTGNRGALYEASTEAIKTIVNGESNWSIEFDLALRGGNTKDRSQDAFALITTASAAPSNSPAFTNTLFAIEQDQPTTGASSTTWYIVNPSATCGATVVADEDKLATATLEIGAFYHYAVVYDNGNVTATISSDNGEVAKVSYKTSYTIADFRGFAACVGRGAGYAYLDNIAVGVPTYAEIVEDPTFQVIGVSYDTVYVKLATETEGAAIKYTLNGGETLTFADSIRLDTTTVIAAWAEKNGEVSNTVNKTVVACLTPAPAITKAGLTYGADTITIKSGIIGSTINYTIDGGDVVSIVSDSVAFITDSTITVAAWNVYENRGSDTTTVKVTAGVVAAPVVTLDKVVGVGRQITFATSTAAASIVYSLDGAAEVVGKAGKDTIVIEKDTKISVLARYTEGAKIFESAKVDTTIAAGTELKLAGVEIATVDYSAQKQAADLKVSTSQLEVLLNPAVDIIWSYGTEEGQSGVAANGDIIKNVPVGATFKAYAKTTGYVTSDTASVTVVPSYASTIFSEDYEDGTTGSWTSHKNWAPVNTIAADGTHFLNFYEDKQSGGRWAQLVFPEYTSTDYSLSFKLGIAAGNGGESKLTVYAGETAFLTFVTPLDLAQAPGERFTTVNGPDGSKVGEFGFYLKDRFVWADDKLANVEITVSESGVVLTVVNNLGQTQVKAKVSDSPVVITKLYEDFARSYGSWRFDDVKIAGRSGAVVAPEFALDHYDVLNPAIAITDATDKTEIYYRAAATTYSYNDKGEIVAGEYTLPETFTKYEAPVVLTDEASIVQAYAVYDGVVSSDTVLSTVFLRLAQVEAPTVTFASVGAAGVQTFSVKDNTPETVSAAIFYQAIGAEKADTLKATSVADTLCGWFNVYAQVGEMKSAPVYRYINGAAAYTEPYFGLAGEAQVTLPASVGDFEVAVGATVAGEYPTAMTTVAGVQKIHYAVNDSSYSAMVLPFAITVGTNVITNAKGDTLVAGEDYELATVHNWGVGRLNGSNMSYLVTGNVANVTVREAGTTISEGRSLLFKAKSAKVGSEVILFSNDKEPVAVEAGVTTMPTKGWRVFGNMQYKNVTLETPAYVLNAAGTELVYTENPTVGPLQIAVLVDATNAATIGNVITLAVSSETGIEQLDAEETLQNGKYMINGKLYIVRGGRQYNAEGAMIK